MSKGRGGALLRTVSAVASGKKDVMSLARSSSTVAVEKSCITRLRNQIDAEKHLIKREWGWLVLGAVWQYVHKVGTNVAYYLHEQRPMLKDMGFELLPELTKQQQLMSEACFFFIFMAGFGIMFTPFFLKQRRPNYFTLMMKRFLVCSVIAQTLRMMCFCSTILPGPNYHCRPGSPDYSPPKELKDFFFHIDAFHGCGDLIFSSHTIFATLMCLTFQKYSDRKGVKAIMWFLLLILGILTVAARKHYSVDVIVAWYTTPLIWYWYDSVRPDVPPEATGYERVREVNSDADLEAEMDGIVADGRDVKNSL